MTKRSMRVAGALLALAVLGGACSNKSKTSTPGGSSGSTGTTVSETPGGIFKTSELNKPQFEGTPSQGGTLTFGLESNVLTIDPGGNMIQPADLEVSTALFDTITEFDSAGKVGPGLAKSWTSTPDLKTWTFKLESGVKFSNGDPFDAAAAVASLTRSKALGAQGKCACASDTANIESMSAPDATTLVVKLKAANVALPVKMAGIMGAMVDAKVAAQMGDKFSTNPIGTGPFKLQTFGPTITAVRNPLYWRKDATGTRLPHLDKIIFKPLPDSKTRLAAVQSGGVDVMQTADTDNLVQAKKDPKLVTQGVTGSSATILILNPNKPPFNDLRARQALNYGLDRVSLNQLAYKGARVPAFGFFPPTDPYYDPKAQLPTYDLAKAKSLIAQLKKEGKKVDYTALCIPTPEATQDFSILKQQSARAGATVTLKTLDQASFVAAMLGGTADYNVACFRSVQAADPDDFYSSLHTGGSTNIPKYSNPEVDKALDNGRKYADIKTRLKIYSTIQAQVTKDVIFVPLLFDLYGNVHSNRVSGLGTPKPNSLGLIDVGSLYFIKK